MKYTIDNEKIKAREKLMELGREIYMNGTPDDIYKFVTENGFGKENRLVEKIKDLYSGFREHGDVGRRMDILLTFGTLLYFVFSMDEEFIYEWNEDFLLKCNYDRITDEILADMSDTLSELDDKWYGDKDFVRLQEIIDEYENADADEYIDGIYGNVVVAGGSYSTADILRKIDWYKYRCIADRMEDGILADFEVVLESFVETILQSRED